MNDVFVTGGSGFVGGRLIAALVSRGVRVRALARSASAAEAVRALGAVPVTGDIEDARSYAGAIAGIDTVFHAAAKADEWGDPREFERVNVAGTDGVLLAARRAGANTFVHVSTEAVLLGQDIVRADETLPVPARSPALYSRTKAAAEARVVAANGPSLRTVVVRPRFVWGAGDTSVLPKIAEAARTGRFAWIGGGTHLTSTTHVENLVEALLLAEEKGRGGEVYFVTDGAPVVFRTFVTALLRTEGVEPPAKSVPLPLARIAAFISERFARATGGTPAVTRLAAELFGREVTIDDGKIRRELGYVGKTTREAGLAALGASRAGQ